MSWSVALTHTFSDATLDVSFASEARVTAIFGPSGAGKTSLARALAGLWKPDTMQATLSGEVLADTGQGIWTRPEARRLGVAFQDARLFPHLSVEANIGYGVPRGADSAFKARLIDILGIGGILGRMPADLSGGEAQRVALARALLPKPRGLILDEPLSALDGPRRAEVLKMLEDLRDQTGTPMLYISHALDEVARLADDLVVLDHGRVVGSGEIAAVLSDLALARYFGEDAVSAVLTARATGRVADGLSELITDAGALFVAGDLGAAGQVYRLRIPARDVMVSLGALSGVSALNQLPATVTEVAPLGEASVLLRLDVGGQPLLSRITRRSAEALALTPGTSVTAVVKSVTVARSEIAQP